AEGHLRLGNPVEISGQLELRSKGDLDQAERGARAIRSALTTFSARGPGPDHGGERRILENAQFTPAAPGLVRVVAPWERADIDRAAQNLAHALSTWAE